MAQVQSAIRPSFVDAKRANLRRLKWRRATEQRMAQPIDPFLKLYLTEELARDTARNS